ncbi:sulfite exporter TauE/SafE family protein [Streptomyces sp. NBC_00234]|uniref:sulfite exporter TauE/SafE family protein n=1 Tax=Streptomyces sp. NBC_00234 TaxID=2903638 RepID=UPI003FA7D442
MSRARPALGVTSLAALVPHARAHRVRWRTGLLFGAFSMVGEYGGGRLAEHIPGRVLLIAFALMMLATAVAMLRKPRKAGNGRDPPTVNCPSSTSPSRVSWSAR